MDTLHVHNAALQFCDNSWNIFKSFWLSAQSTVQAYQSHSFIKHSTENYQKYSSW